MPSIISTKTSGGGGIAVTGDTSGVLQLQSANGTTAVTIDASQNVGIGTASPTQKLEVYQPSGTNSYINTVSGAVQAYYGASTGGFGNVGALGTIGAYPQIFFTNSTERMRIDTSGNLLVGAASQIGGERLGATFNGAVAQGIYVIDSSAASASTMIGFYKAGAQRGAIISTATATSYGTSSDYRLKENIAPMTGALDTIAQLKPVTYKWKSDGSDGQGFIAHELQEVVPDCVTGEKDAVDADGNPIYQGIDTSFLVATLTAAIQELKARIEVLEGASA
jgi:hypothetical protein